VDSSCGEILEDLTGPVVMLAEKLAGVDGIDSALLKPRAIVRFNV
jgi:hypothetical protein